MKKILTRSELIPNDFIREHVIYNSTRSKDSMFVLLEAKRAWESLRDFRKKVSRNRDYTFGRQWNDKITDESGNMVTEEVYLKSQGKVPLKNNLIRQLVKAVTGQFGSDVTEPIVTTFDRREQSLGEMMTIALQSAYETNKMREVDMFTLENFLISGACFHKIRYGFRTAFDKKDVWIDPVSNHRIFFNNNMEDPRHWDCNLIGEIHDMKLSDVIAQFSMGNKERAKGLIDIYKNITLDSISQNLQNLSSERIDSLDFFTPSEYNLCRVIEVWKLESKERLKCHDVLNGSYFMVELTELHKLENENSKRLDDGLRNGVEPDDIPLIDYEWCLDLFWYARWMSPYGDVFLEMETPYWHKSHPYIFKLYPFIDGEVHSFVEDVIDQQRYINRLITMIDFIMGSSAKGVLLFPEDQIPDGMTIEDVAQEWTRYNGVILFKPKPGQQLPTQISTNATNVGAYDLLSLQMRLMNDISGVHGALQGKPASSGTAASLYAQESQNSITNLVGLFDAFKNFREQRDYKMMKTIQQYYNEPRYMNIVGSTYSDESKYYNPESVKNAEFDLKITESISTPSYRSAVNDMLMELFKAGAVTVKDVLENGAFPFADRILESINKREEDMKNNQAASGSVIPPELMREIASQSSPELQKAMD